MKIKQTRKFKTFKSTPGQGRRPVNTAGIIDKTELHAVIPWPDICK